MKTYKFVKEAGGYGTRIELIVLDLGDITYETEFLRSINDPSCLMSTEFRKTSTVLSNEHICQCRRSILIYLLRDGWTQSESILLRDALVKKAEYERVTEKYIEFIYDMKDSGYSIETILSVIDCEIPGDEEDKPTLERKDIDMDKSTIDKHLMTIVLLRDSLAYDESDRDRFVHCLILSGMDYEEACNQFEHVLVEQRSKVEALDFCIDLLKEVK